MCVCMCACSVLSDFLSPVDCSLLGFSSMGFSRQEYWSGLPCPSPGDLSDPGIEPASFTSPALAGRFFTTSAMPGSEYWIDTYCLLSQNGVKLTSFLDL